jgi:hypothetical protein
MRDDRIDLRALDPTLDPERFQRLVAGIGRGAAAELAARRARATVIGQITAWRRPMLAAAATLLIVSGAVLWSTREDDSREGMGVVEAVGVPTSLASWVRSGDMPGPGQLLLALQETP